MTDIEAIKARAEKGVAMLNVLDLFSGIGGFSLGLERTGGFETVAFCEIEEYPRRVLAKHWPEVPCYEDVRKIVADTGSIRCDAGRAEQSLQGAGAHGKAWATNGTTRAGPVDVITAGFPCQDISYAGAGAGIDGERSGLWSEVARLTGELRPRYVVLENVAALLGRGLGRVLGDLAEVGYDAEWHCIPASHIGAPHRRDRWWCVAYPQHQRSEIRHAEHSEPYQQGQAGNALPRGEDMADSDQPRPQGYGGLLERACQRAARENRGSEQGIWFAEPDVGRVAHGIPKRVDRLKGLGNAVVPQIPELIGRAILEAALDALEKDNG